MKGQPFKRAEAMLAAIGTIMAATENNFAERQARLNALTSYVSRGKGKGKTSKARRGTHMDLVRTAKKIHNINKRK